MKEFKVEGYGEFNSTLFIKESELNDVLAMLLQKGFRLTEAFEGDDYFLEGEKSVVSISSLHFCGVQTIERLIDSAEK